MSGSRKKNAACNNSMKDGILFDQLLIVSNELLNVIALNKRNIIAITNKAKVL